jgi:hypothetical protein
MSCAMSKLFFLYDDEQNILHVGFENHFVNEFFSSEVISISLTRLFLLASSSRIIMKLIADLMTSQRNHVHSLNVSQKTNSYEKLHQYYFS